MRAIKGNPKSYFKSLFNFYVKENESEPQYKEHRTDDSKTSWKGVSYITILRGLLVLRR